MFFQFLQQFIILIERLSETFKNYDILIRPHPNEWPETWKILTKDISNNNIKIRKDKSLIEYINFSEILIHSGCTAAIEAYFIKKKIISFVPNDFKDSFDSNFPNSLGVISKNIDETIKLIRDIDKIDNYKIGNSKYANRVYNYNIDKLSSDLIVEKWLDLYKKNEINIQKSFLKMNTLNYFVSKKRNLNLKINLIFLKLMKNKTNFFNAFPDFSKKIIDETFEGFCNYNRDIKKIKYKICNNKILRVYKT